MTIRRICLTPTDSENYDPEYNITVDLDLLDSGVPTNRMTAFGVRGGLSQNATNIEPFLLFADGSGDFGSGWEEERDFHFNLRGTGRAVMIGELFTYKCGGEEITYRVTQVINLE